MVDVSTLNERQLDAVNWNSGPLLVLAGPGSGKTKVLTTRIARLLEESPSEHYRILGLTFTNKAAAEMRQRIEASVPSASSRVLLTTFHSFAGDILRQHGHLIGLRPDFTIVTQDSERVALLEEALRDIDSELSGERFLPLINRMIENDVIENGARALTQSFTPDQQEVAFVAFEAYKDKLVASNCLDFPSLIARAVGILREAPAVTRQVQRIYKFICVDEFQDTNVAQYSLLRLLIGQERNLLVVADDDQIIYQWNGASPERLQAIRQDFAMKEIQLPANYRCPPVVIEIANKLIVKNTIRSEGKERLLALKPSVDGDTLRVLSFPSFEDELNWIADDMRQKSASERSRSVVLARTRKALEGVVERLTDIGIAAYLAMRKDEFVSPPLVWMHAALRLANNPQDREQVRRLCKAFYSVEGIQIDSSSVVALASVDGSALRAFATAALSRQEVSEVSRCYLSESLPLLADRLDFRGFVKSTFSWFEMIQDSDIHSGEPFAEYIDEKATWSELAGEIESQFGKDAVTLNVLLQELDMRSKTPTPPKGAISCFTIHASKGMEFGHVYLIGMVEDQLPSWAAVKKGPDSQEMQEERRNCFVAITRTEETLTITYSGRMFGWPKAPSRFLSEMELIDS